jgi:hypothetical protein
MGASDYIALAAVVLSLLVALRNELSLRSERKDREREDERGDERLQLLRAQVEGEAEHRLNERRADLVCRQGSRGGAGEGFDEYDVALVNGGRSTAHDLSAWIATEDGQAIGGPQRPGDLVPDAQSPWFKLRLGHEDSRNRPRRLFIRVSWTDGAGEHEENIEELGHV